MVGVVANSMVGPVAGGTPVLLQAAFLLPSGGTGGGWSLMTAIGEAPTAQRVTAPLDPLTPLWQLSELPAGRTLDDPDQELSGTAPSSPPPCRWATPPRPWTSPWRTPRSASSSAKPIGSFQAIKHLCADMLVRAEVARNAVHAAACLADAPDVLEAEATSAGSTPLAWQQRAVAGAKLLADEAAITNARVAIQVHGGMG